MNHEVIWAPWRLGYILHSQDEAAAAEKPVLLPGGDADCFLCRDAAEGDDRQRLVLARGHHAITVMNRYPYNNGHLLVAPCRHHARLAELTAAEQTEIGGMITEMVAILEQVLRPEGFNIGLNLGRAAGAGVPGHLHWHIVPRWVGDTNFMPVNAGVRVIPQSLDALWDLLIAASTTPASAAAAPPSA